MDAVAIVRAFNRTYTQRIGALETSFLGTGLPLGAARVLFEVGQGGIAIRDLRGRLGLDSGYLSRLLRELEHGGLVAVQADRADRRVRVVTLTARGRRLWQQLDRRSDAIAAQLLDGLTERQHTELTGALATAQRLVRLATLELAVVDPRSPAAVAALAAYFAELDRRFPGGFAAPEPTAEADAYEAPRGGFVLARCDVETAACGGWTRVDATTAEIKRMWVAPGWRGAGLGRRMLATLEDRAREHGFRRVILDTNPVLDEAIAMYRSAGYREIARYNDNPYAGLWFAKRLDRRRSA